MNWSLESTPVEDGDGFPRMFHVAVNSFTGERRVLQISDFGGVLTRARFEKLAAMDFPSTRRSGCIAPIEANEIDAMFAERVAAFDQAKAA